LESSLADSDRLDTLARGERGDTTVFLGDGSECADSLTRGDVFGGSESDGSIAFGDSLDCPANCSEILSSPGGGVAVLGDWGRLSDVSLRERTDSGLVDFFGAVGFVPPAGTSLFRFFGDSESELSPRDCDFGLSVDLDRGLSHFPISIRKLSFLRTGLGSLEEDDGV